MNSSQSPDIPSKSGGDLSQLVVAWRLAAKTYKRLAKECHDTAKRIEEFGSVFPAGELAPLPHNGLAVARTSEPAGTQFDDPGETRAVPESLSPEPGLSPGPVCAEAGNLSPVLVLAEPFLPTVSGTGIEGEAQESTVGEKAGSPRATGTPAAGDSFGRRVCRLCAGRFTPGRWDDQHVCQACREQAVREACESAGLSAG